MQPQNKKGTLADRLGNGLQNRVEQFDSARYLKQTVLLDGFPQHFLFIVIIIRMVIEITSLTHPDAGYEPTALLCEEKHITGDAADIISRCGDIPVYTGSRQLLTQLTGYILTHGVLCAMRRPKPRGIAEVCKDARRIVVIKGVVDTTNIGAIFRSAAALGIDTVLLTPDSCDPLNRRAVRVSMGTVFLVPWTWMSDDINELHQYGFRTAAMALTDDSISLDDKRLKQEERLAIIMGTEGDGLPHQTIAIADYVVRIPMAHQVDSLNVAAATAVACWELGKH